MQLDSLESVEQREQPLRAGAGQHGDAGISARDEFYSRDSGIVRSQLGYLRGHPHAAFDGGKRGSITLSGPHDETGSPDEQPEAVCGGINRGRYSGLPVPRRLIPLSHGGPGVCRTAGLDQHLFIPIEAAPQLSDPAKFSRLGLSLHYDIGCGKLNRDRRTVPL
ncbi:hypothetical protein D3C77_533110 [compost metagenome]